MANADSLVLREIKVGGLATSESALQTSKICMGNIDE